MRKSLQDIRHMVRDIPYPNALPEEIAHLHCYIEDAGHCILAIPESLAADMTEEPYMYEVPMPVRYVLAKGWKALPNTDSVIVPAEYDSMLGVVIPFGYEEF